SGQASSWKFEIEKMSKELIHPIKLILGFNPEGMPLGIPTGGEWFVKHSFAYYAKLTDFLEGAYPTQVTLFDDVVTTGASMRAATQVIESSKARVVDKLCLLNRSEDLYECRSILTLEDVLAWLEVGA
ncbi:hypothetical protein LCGC14_2397080, partial [marine sediment metagenome]